MATTTATLLSEMFTERMPGLAKRRYCPMCETYTSTRECKACGMDTERVPAPTCIECGARVPHTNDPQPTCTRCLALDKDRGIESRSA